MTKYCILVSAYGCEPYKGSEQGVGWHWVLEIAKIAEVWVITRSNNQEAIESALPESMVDRIHFIYYDLPDHWRYRLKRKEKGLYFYYTLWQWGAYLLAKNLVRQYKFNYCQHLTFGNMWLPTFMHKLPVPFIWGPIGGGEAVPFDLINSLPWRSRAAQYARYLLMWFVKLNPLFSGPASAACAIIVRTEESRKALPIWCRNKTYLMLETGVSETQVREYSFLTTTRLSPCIKIVYTGRLIALKNVAMAIKAFALAFRNNSNIRFTIVGDGPLRKTLEVLTQNLGMEGNINFAGAVTQLQVIEILGQSDIFLFPSLKEGGTWSLIEAMAVGLPVICIDSTGMHVITDETCAIRISPEKAKNMTNKMADAISALADSHELRQKMSDNACKRIASQFLWEQKGLFMTKLLADLDRTHDNLSAK